MGFGGRAGSEVIVGQAFSGKHQGHCLGRGGLKLVKRGWSWGLTQVGASPRAHWQLLPWQGVKREPREPRLFLGFTRAAALAVVEGLKLSPVWAEGCSGVVLAGQLEHQALFILLPLCWDWE